MANGRQASTDMARIKEHAWIYKLFGFPCYLSRKSREELFLLRQEFNPPGIMQARQVHIVYASLTMRLPGETSQQEQLLHHVQEQTQISPLLQSYHLPCALCCALLGRHTNVLTMHTPGDRQWAAPYCHQRGWLHPRALLSGGFSSFSCRRCSVPQQASGKIQYVYNSYSSDTSGILYSEGELYW